MNERDLFRAIGDIDEDLIAGADTKASPKRPIRFYLSTAIAACLCVALLFVALHFLPMGTNDTGTTIALSANEGKPENQELTTPAQQPENDPLTGSSSNPAIYGEIAPTDAGLAHFGTGTPGSVTGEIPEDFSFTIVWSGKFYDSAAGVFTDSEGQTLSLNLTEAELAQAWQLIQLLDVQRSDDAAFRITCTANGETAEFAVSETAPDEVLTVCKVLTELIEQAVNRVR